MVYDLERRRKSNPLATDQEDIEEADSFTSAELRREKIIKLRLDNEIAREELRLIRRETLSQEECEAVLRQIKERVSAELAVMRAEVSTKLAGKNPAEVQQILEAETRKVLDNLSKPEVYA